MNWLIITIFGLIGLIIFIIIMSIYILANPIKYEKVQYLLYLLLNRIFKIKKYQLTVQEIQLKINEYLDESGLKDIGRPLAKIELVSPSEAKVLVEKGEMIMKIVPKRNVSQNLISATLTYVSKGIIPESKPYLGEDLVRAIDLTLAELILLNKTNTQTVEIFKKNILMPAIKTYSNLKILNEKLKQLDWQGMFTRILLREFAMISAKKWETLEKKEIITEAHNFLNFLIKISDKEEPLDFSEKLINIRILLVAKKGKILTSGFGPYFNAINVAISNRMERIYILSRHENNDYAKYIAMRAQSKKVKIINTYSYAVEYVKQDGIKEKVPACCIILEPIYQ